MYNNIKDQAIRNRLVQPLNFQGEFKDFPFEVNYLQVQSHYLLIFYFARDDSYQYNSFILFSFFIYNHHSFLHLSRNV